MEMTRRSILSLAATIPLQARAAERRFNVVFMVADDMNTALGCHGRTVVKTPNLDGLAKRSVLFERAYCQFPLCAPSRASFLSGRRPERTRVLSLDVPTRAHMRNAVMIPELFRNHGYHTANCGKIFHTGPEHEDARSWDFVLPESGKSPPASEIVAKHVAPKPRNHSMEWDQLRTPDEKTPDGIVARIAAEQIRSAVRNKQPFFVGVGFRRPHSPYAVPKKYFDLYNPSTLELPLSSAPETFPPAARYELDNQPRLSAKEQREYLAAYYASNSFVDAQAGTVFRVLDEMQLWDSTVVVFLGDNGYHTGEHGMWHKMTLFEESVRVPLIIHTPGARGAGRTCPGLVELIDLYPTIAAACGLKQPPGLDGISLTPLLDDPAQPGKKAAFSLVGRADDRTQSHHNPTYFGRSVRTARWRYTEWDGGARGTELYDEQNDPGEFRNLARDARYGQVAVEMKALLSTLPPV